MTLLALRIAVPTPLRRLFDYLPPAGQDITQLKAGMRVRIPFQKRELVGILVATTETPALAWDKLKPAIQVIDSEAVIVPEIWQLCQWAADYYHYALGEVLAGALPALLRQGKAPALLEERYWQLTAAENDIPEALKKAPKQVELVKLLAENPEGLSTKDISKHGFTSAQLRSLSKKGLVHQCERFAVPAKLTPVTYSLNTAQEAAVIAIKESMGRFQAFLLDGITGSGKTEVYLQSIMHYLQQDKQVLALVPEIGLTPQTIQRFRERFSVPVIALHSGLTEKERLSAWILAKSGQAKIIIGTRSAVFTPFAALGLIVIDEEHDPSFKQQEGFRYHARDVSIMRAHFGQIPVVLGSATPSLETLQNIQSGRYHYLQLPERAGVAKLPEFHVLDIRKKSLDEGLSPALLAEMRLHLAAGNQVMLFLNRRGFAPVLMCHSCGWTAICRSCDSRMTYHQQTARMHCHHCDKRQAVLTTCDGCGEKSLYPIGVGTERLEEALTRHFSHLSIARIDRDNTQRKGQLEQLLDKIQRGEHQILIGTQMLAKGHHFPNVTLVGVIDADHGFFSADFRSLERMGQLVLQVAGRAGRSEKPGKVYIQTHHPDHPLLHQLINDGYSVFAKTLLKERKETHLPPYVFFALFRAEAYNHAHAIAFLQQIKNIMTELRDPIKILGPIPAPMAKRAGRHRAQLLVQSFQRPSLQQFLKALLPAIEKLPSQHRVHWSLDIDPIDIF